MFLDKPVADRHAVQTVSRLNRRTHTKDHVIVVDFTNNARAILKAFNKYRHGSPHDPDEPNPQKCLDLYEEVISTGVFTQEDSLPVLELIEKNDDATLQATVATLRTCFQESISDTEERKNFVHLLAKFVKSYHFLSSFFSYEKHIPEFVAFCEYVGPQLIKSGSVSELMKQVRATIVERAAVIEQGSVEMPSGLIKPKPSKGGVGGAPPPRKVSVQDMIQKIRDQFEISDDEALYIREVSQEKIEDESILQTIAAHRDDTVFLNNIFKDQVNGQIQDAYVLRELYERVADPKYVDPGGIFDIMAYTVIQEGIERAGAA